MAKQYEVQKILKKRINSEGKPEYLIKWLGYPETEATWEPRQHLLNIQDFLKNYDSKVHRNSLPSKTHQIVKKQIPKTAKGRKSREQIMSNLLKSKRVSISQSEEADKRQMEKSAIKGRAYRSGISRLHEKASQQIIQPSPEPMSKALAEGAEGEERQNSIINSDQSEGVQIVDLKIHNQIRYFRVRTATSIDWKSSQQVKRKHAIQLIEFYEKHIFPDEEE